MRRIAWTHLVETYAAKRTFCGVRTYNEHVVVIDTRPDWLRRVACGRCTDAFTLTLKPRALSAGLVLHDITPRP